MKIIVVGATGVIGRAVSTALSQHHEVIRVARSGADIMADVTSTESIRTLFRTVGPFDALVSAVGAGGIGELVSVDEEAFNLGWRTKVIPQVNLVLYGLHHVKDSGSFTLSSGVLSKRPMRGFSAVAATNGAIDAFCKAAALEMPRAIRINCVSPVFVTESMHAAGLTNTSGYVTQSAADTAKAYVAAIMGDMQGQDIDPIRI